VRVYDVDLVLFEITREATNLAQGMQIVKTIEPELGNVVETESIQIAEQHSITVQRGDKHVAASAFDQQSS